MSFQIFKLNFHLYFLFDVRKGHLQRASSVQCEISLVERSSTSAHHSEYTQNGMSGGVGEILVLCVDLCSQSFNQGDPKNFLADFVLIINFAHEDKFISNVTDIVFFPK